MLAEQIVEIMAEANEAAYEAAKELAFKFELEGRFTGCGFAWIELYEFDGRRIKGKTKIGKQMKKAGIRQNYQRVFDIWNPSGYPTQDVSVLEAGAQAAAEVFKKHGFNKVYACSRLD